MKNYTPKHERGQNAISESINKINDILYDKFGTDEIVMNIESQDIVFDVAQDILFSAVETHHISGDISPLLDKVYKHYGIEVEWSKEPYKEPSVYDWVMGNIDPSTKVSTITKEEQKTRELDAVHNENYTEAAKWRDAQND